jgi:hypothetical protein
MSITAKIKVTGKTPVTDGQTTLNFLPDYLTDEGKAQNKEWAKYTPCLQLSMTVLDSIAEQFEPGQPFTLTFTPEHA